jgi:hypothetical protein
VISHETSRRVSRSVAATFDVIGTHVYDNHPLWEREVLEVRPITPGAVGLGSRAVMVRRDYGRRTEVEYVVTEFEKDRRIGFHHPAPSMDFRISFELSPVDADTCDVHVAIRAQPLGWTRALEPLMRRAMPKQAERITAQMARIVESRNAG